MRRIPRLRQPSAVLTQCLQTTTSAASQHAAVSRTAAAAATTSSGLAARPRDFSTTPSRPGPPSRVWVGSAHGNKIPGSGACMHSSAAQQGPSPAPTDDHYDQGGEEWERPLAKRDTAEIETDLVIPSRKTTHVPRSEDILEAGLVKYRPATSANNLKVVGGLDGWFDKEEHLPESKLRVPLFAPRHKVANSRLLELCVRRAVVEALAAQQQDEGSSSSKNSKKSKGKGKGKNNTKDDNPKSDEPALLFRSWGGRTSTEAAKRACALGVKVDREGAAKLTGDVGKVLEDLKADPEEEALGLSVNAASRTAYLRPSEIQEMVSDSPANWKRISLRDERLKFAVTKRVLQLTGQRVPDTKLVNADSAGALLTLLDKDKRQLPTKVYDVVMQQGELTRLRNVEVLLKRRTPISEARKVGSWKVMKRILEKRGLPVTGTGGVGKFVEDEWYRGARPIKKGRKRA